MITQTTPSKITTIGSLNIKAISKVVSEEDLDRAIGRAIDKVLGMVSGLASNMAVRNIRRWTVAIGVRIGIPTNINPGVLPLGTYTLNHSFLFLYPQFI